MPVSEVKEPAVEIVACHARSSHASAEQLAADRVLFEEAGSERGWHRVNADGDAGIEAAVEGGAAAAGAGGFLVHDDQVCAAAEELKELAAGLLPAEDHGPRWRVRDAEEHADAALVARLTPVLVVWRLRHLKRPP